MCAACHRTCFVQVEPFFFVLSVIFRIIKKFKTIFGYYDSDPGFSQQNLDKILAGLIDQDKKNSKRLISQSKYCSRLTTKYVNK